MDRVMSRIALLGIGCTILGLSAFGQHTPLKEEEEEDARRSTYVGISKCKNCHRSAKAGDQFGKWTASRHAKAFEALGSDEAKRIAKEKGVEDPQKSDACVKCHVTAFGVDEARLGKKFKKEDGVQCETCHGPGEKHVKDRMAAAADGEGQEDAPVTKIPEGEIVASSSTETCLGCHNSESPTFKPLCIQDISREVLHFDPRRNRTEEEIAKIKKTIEEQLAAKNASCGGPEKCEKCKKAAGK